MPYLLSARRRLRFCSLGCSVLLAAAPLGCVSEKEAKKPVLKPDLGSGAIDEINLLAMPVAVDVDPSPGPDAFLIKVYASNRRRPKPIPIESGKIEVVMYDGVPGVTESISIQPRRTWTYTAEELRPFEIRSSIGTGYQIAPAWGTSKPVRDKIAVVVRYTPGTGPVISSAPSIIAVR